MYAETTGYWQLIGKKPKSIGDFVSNAHGVVDTSENAQIKGGPVGRISFSVSRCGCAKMMNLQEYTSSQ